VVVFARSCQQFLA